MRFVGLSVSCAIVIAACGGQTTDLDGGSVDSGGGKDATSDAPAACTPPNTQCATSCPSGTVCLRRSGPTEVDLGCTPIPPACNGVATCNCMMACFCPDNGINKCVAETDGSFLCTNGAISRRAFKEEIEYVASDEREELAREALAIPLATYRYKTDDVGAKRHLGFIIDDQPKTSPAVASDATHVDEYGYASMLLATVQEQQKQIDALRKQVEALQRKR
jgi:hypothetical protein